MTKITPLPPTDDGRESSDARESSGRSAPLIDKQDRFRRLAESVPVGLFEADPKGTITFVNDRWRQLARYDGPVPITFSVVHKLLHPDDRDDIQEAFVVSRISHTAFDITSRIIGDDGAQRSVRFQGSPVLNPDGSFGGFVGTVVDVSEPVEATTARHRSQQRYHELLAAAPVGQAVYALDGALVEVNRAWAQLLGYQVDEVIGTPGASHVHPEDRQNVVLAANELISGEIEHLLEERRLIHRDGSVVWVSSSITVERDVDGMALFFHSLVLDITDRHNAMQALRESEVRFRTLAESLPVGVFHADLNAQIDYANPRWLEITDVDPDHLSDPATVEIIHEDDRRAMGRELRDAFSEHRPYHVQYRIRNKAGDLRWLSGRGSRTYDSETGLATGIVGSIEDVTPLVEAHEQTTRLAGIIESTSDLVNVVDWETRLLTYLNRSARDLFGYAGRDITTVHYLDLFTPTAACSLETVLETLTEPGRTWSGELEMYASDRSTILVWQTIAAQRTAEGRILQLSAVGRDVTERRKVEDGLVWQASHDLHTGLPNRALLMDRLELALGRSERDHRLVAVLFLDLDRFKQVNDTMGHESGDELLVAAAQRISNVLRPSDTVSRIGGDEFVVLADEVDDEDHALAIGRRIADSIENEPFILHQQAFPITASIGIALARGGDAHPEALLRDADAAMYRAKDLGRNRLEMFDENMRQRVAHRNEMADQLATGIEQDNITVYYQPCVDLETGVVTGVEALARWEHPIRGILSPYEFIALAEDTGLIIGLGLAVLSKACHQGFVWHERFGADAPLVHVNLSARQLTANNLPTLVEGVLRGTGLPATKLCLEITESVLMDDAASVIDTLWALKAIGVSIAIDDFGTGYSSLSYLRRFPVDVLKVDQSFVNGLGPDPEDSAIVAAIVNLAGSLELDSIAEGVETLEQLERLRALGCRAAQGFFFSEPRLPEEIEGFFSSPFEI